MLILGDLEITAPGGTTSGQGSKGSSIVRDRAAAKPDLQSARELAPVPCQEFGAYPMAV